MEALHTGQQCTGWGPIAWCPIKPFQEMSMTRCRGMNTRPDQASGLRMSKTKGLVTWPLSTRRRGQSMDQSSCSQQDRGRDTTGYSAAVRPQREKMRPAYAPANVSRPPKVHDASDTGCSLQPAPRLHGWRGAAPSYKYRSSSSLNVFLSSRALDLERTRRSASSQVLFSIVSRADIGSAIASPNLAAMNKTSGGNNAFHNFNNDFAHIRDPNERRRLALAEIDKAPFGWYHIFAINLVTSMLGVVFFNDSKSHGTIPPSSDTAIKVATSGGTVLGQLGFGYLADVVGRKRMYGLELIIIIFATLAQALSSPSRAISVTGIIIFWRGIGIGGDYPLSSIITSEFATTKWRGAMMNAVFAMQGIGQFTAAIMALIVTTGFRGSLESAAGASTCHGVCQLAVDKMWRIIVGFGAVPGCIALYYRLTIPETPRYTFDVARDAEKAGADVSAYMQGKAQGHPDEIRRVTPVTPVNHVTQTLQIPPASFADFLQHYGQWQHGKVLLGTAGSWFFLDVAFYGLGLNNSIILAAIGWTGGDSMYEIFRRNAIGNLILVCAGAIPGYWVSVATIDTLGRKPIQIGGFAILTALFAGIGFGYSHLSGRALLALYVLAQFFFNFGPNSTTFVVPGECFPTRYRSTSHGFSAAAGKLGAILAQVVFGPLRTRGAAPGAKGRAASPWLNHIMQIFALFMLAGLVTSFLIPETKRKTLEELAGEVLAPPYYDHGAAAPSGVAGGRRDLDGRGPDETGQPEKARAGEAV
ncbi:hypothetical protein JHW43_007713 [Diplocarpon mali]|nr:hypothetical protein JHW43_007713 [Diplocarpon mali]